MTEMDPSTMDMFVRPDPILTNKIVTYVKSQGIFDQFRRECMADVDTKPAYQNLRQRVEGSVAAFLRKNPWRPDMNKNQLRDNLRKHIQSGGFLDIGVDRIVDQVVNPKIYTVFLPKVEEVVQTCLVMENDQVRFEPPPQPVENQEPPKFQDKHNLAPRARIQSLAGPRMPCIPNIEALKPPQSLDNSLGDIKLSYYGSPDQDEVADDNYVADDDDTEENGDDDEESPAFEPHSETDRLILGVRTDSSDSNSEENQVVTSIVDDNLEERIDNNDMVINEGIDIREEEETKDDEESSSDEYVIRTPNMNMEGSDGSGIEIDLVNDYKQYQTKFDEESFGNIVEEVVSCQWIDETSELTKEDKSSTEDEAIGDARKRRINEDNLTEESNSSIDKGSASDEGKTHISNIFVDKKLNVEEYVGENEVVSEMIPNENSNPEKSIDMLELKLKLSENEHRDKSKNSSSSSKDSSKSHNTHHSRPRDSSSHHSKSSKDKSIDKEYRESSVSSTNSFSKKDGDRREDKNDISRDRNKVRERKKSESSSTKYDKHHDKDKDCDKKRTDKVESLKNKDDGERDKKEYKRENRDRSKDHHDREKKKHNKHSSGKRDSDSTHRHDKDKRDSSKHGHSSSKHSHRSSSEKHKSSSKDKHRESDKHSSHDKKTEKDSKHESRKKQREHCKSNDKDSERRSTDRDSNGPSGRSYISSTSRSTSSRTHTDTSIEFGDRTTSNSDNAVSESIEALHDDNSKFDSVSEPGIASPDPESAEDFWNRSDSIDDHGNQSTDISSNLIDTILHSCQDITSETCMECVSVINIEGHKIESDILNKTESFQSITNKEKQENKNIESNIHTVTNEIFQNNTKNVDHIDQNFPPPAVLDTSSEKENIEQDLNCKESQKNVKEIVSNFEPKIIKFKKPKIAANIFEVKKIMQARRHLKRIEKKRMKLLLKNKTEESLVQKDLHSENSKGEQLEDEGFKGFEDSSSDKIEKYSCLISRLSNEVEAAMSSDNANPNLVTSWIDLDPKFDEYIETVLKGKVHRKWRVRLPPISNEHYRFDAEQNVYILISNEDESVIPKEKQSANKSPNNIYPILKIHRISTESNQSEDEHHQIKKQTFNGSNTTVKKNIFEDDEPPLINSEQNSMLGEESKSDVNCEPPTEVNELPSIKRMQRVISKKISNVTKVSPVNISKDTNIISKTTLNNSKRNILPVEENKQYENCNTQKHVSQLPLNRKVQRVVSGNSLTVNNASAVIALEDVNTVSKPALNSSEKNSISVEENKVYVNCESSRQIDKLPTIEKAKRVVSGNNVKVNNVSAVIASEDNNITDTPVLKFNLTFNQTYDEILKEKEPDSVVISKQPKEDMHKSSRTVVKITNSNTTEQVFIKTVHTDLGDRCEVPTIMRSESIRNSEQTPQRKQIPLISRINGNISKQASLTKQLPLISRVNGNISKQTTQTKKVPLITRINGNVSKQSPQIKQPPHITRINGNISKQTPQGKELPLISRINKSKSVVAPSASTARSLCLSGIVSPDSTITLEAEVADRISQKLINEVIGIQDDSTCHVQLNENDGVYEENSRKRRHEREDRSVASKQQQRYDSSDLYKPRQQLLSRRVRAQLSTEVHTPSPVRTRKRPANTPSAALTQPKRRR